MPTQFQKNRNHLKEKKHHQKLNKQNRAMQARRDFNKQKDIWYPAKYRLKTTIPINPSLFLLFSILIFSGSVMARPKMRDTQSKGNNEGDVQSKEGKIAVNQVLVNDHSHDANQKLIDELNIAYANYENSRSHKNHDNHKYEVNKPSLQNQGEVKFDLQISKKIERVIRILNNKNGLYNHEEILLINEILNYQDVNQNTFLHYLAKDDENYVYLQRLLVMHPDISITNNRGDTPFSVAYNYAQEKNLELLTEYYLKYSSKEEFLKQFPIKILYFKDENGKFVEETNNSLEIMLDYVVKKNLKGISLLSQFIKIAPGRLINDRSITRVLKTILNFNRKDLLYWFFENNLFFEIDRDLRDGNLIQDLYKFFNMLISDVNFNEEMVKELIFLISKKTNKILDLLNLFKNLFHKYNGHLIVKDEFISIKAKRLERLVEYAQEAKDRNNLINIGYLVLGVLCGSVVLTGGYFAKIFIEKFFHEESLPETLFVSFLNRQFALDFWVDKEEYKAKLLEVMMLPMSHIKKIGNDNNNLYEYQGIKYFMVKKKDYCDALNKICQKHKLDLRYEKNYIVLPKAQTKKIQQHKDFMNDFFYELKQFKYENENILFSSRDLDSKIEMLGDEYKRLASSCQSRSLSGDFMIQKELKQIQKQVKDISEVFEGNLIYSCEKREISELDVDHPSEGKLNNQAAHQWKRASDRILKQLDQVKIKIANLKKNVQDALTLQTQHVSPAEPKQEQSVTRRKKLSNEKKWLFQPETTLSSSSSASSADAAPFASPSISQNKEKSTSDSDSTPKKTVKSEKISEKNQKTHAQNVGSIYIEPEKAKDQSQGEIILIKQISISAEQKIKFRLLLDYIDQIKRISKKSAIDNNEFHALQYLWMRMTVILAALKALLLTEIKIDFLRNQFVHGLSTEGTMTKNEILALSETLNFIQTDVYRDEENQTIISSLLTQLITRLVNTDLQKKVSELHQAWRKAKESNQALYDAITFEEAINQISDHLMTIKKLFKVKSNFVSISFYESHSSLDDMIDCAIQWHIFAIHLCLELCPSFLSHEKIKNFNLLPYIEHIQKIRNLAAHTDIDAEKKIKEQLRIFEMSFNSSLSDLLMSINAIKLNVQ